MHPSALAQSRHPAPRILGQRLQERRSIPLFSGSCRPWACSPWTMRSGDGEPAPSFTSLEFLSPPPHNESPTGPQSDLGVSPSYSVPRHGLPPLQVALYPMLLPSSTSASTFSFILPFIHSFIPPCPSFIHSYPPTPPVSAFHSFIHSFIFPVLLLAHAPLARASSAQAQAGRGPHPPIAGDPPASRRLPASP